MSYDSFLSILFIDDFAHNKPCPFRKKTISVFEACMSSLKKSCMEITYVTHVSVYIGKGDQVRAIIEFPF